MYTRPSQNARYGRLICWSSRDYGCYRHAGILHLGRWSSSQISGGTPDRGDRLASGPLLPPRPSWPARPCQWHSWHTVRGEREGGRGEMEGGRKGGGSKEGWMMKRGGVYTQKGCVWLTNSQGKIYTTNQSKDYNGYIYQNLSVKLHSPITQTMAFLYTKPQVTRLHN